MKLAIVGSRTFEDYDQLKAEINPTNITEIVSGGAMGADTLAEKYAREFGIPITIFHADWKKFGPSAGPKRNTQIVEYCDAVIAFWDGSSSGTKDTISKTRRAKKPIKVVIYF